MDDLGFFPITVELVTAPRTLYRACRGTTVADLTESMRSNYDATRPPHPTDLKATILHMAV